VRITCQLLVVFAFLLAACSSKATPFFARQFGMPCASCHSGFPRLNEFGLAFKANNFRIPGPEDKSSLIWRKTIPIAARVKPSIQRFYFEPGSFKGDITETQVLAGGQVLPRTSFYIHSTLFYDGFPVGFPSWEAWGQYVLDERSKIMLKAGQFEPPYAFSTQINQTTIFPPLLFTALINGNDVAPGYPI